MATSWVKLIFLVTLIGCSSEALTQSKLSDNLSISGNYHLGYVIPEYGNFLLIINQKVNAVSLNVSKKTRGKSDWEKIYNYPEYGVSLFYSTLGNDKIHGREMVISPYCRFDIIARKRFAFFNETSLGLSYVTKKFDSETNYLNIAVGSHLNLHLGLRFGSAVRLSDKLKLRLGLAFDHFSNGNLQNPNLGLNSVTSFTGLSYQIGDFTPLIEREVSPHTQSVYYEAIFNLGMKRPRGVLESRIYYPSSLTLETKWKAMKTIHIGIGADGFYDPSTKTEMDALSQMSYKQSDDFRTGIHISQQFTYNKLSIIIQEGLYIGFTNPVNGKKMYNRGIVRVQMNDKMFVQLAMKSHLHILDYPELGLGISFK